MPPKRKAPGEIASAINMSNLPSSSANEQTPNPPKKTMASTQAEL